jgi:hypothetical protein
VILLGDVATRDVTMIDIRCGRCDRHGHLSVKRLLARYGPDAAMGTVMREQIGSCTHRDDAQIQTRCDPYCPTLAQLFGIPDPS